MPRAPQQETSDTWVWWTVVLLCIYVLEAGEKWSYPYHCLLGMKNLLPGARWLLCAGCPSGPGTFCSCLYHDPASRRRLEQWPLQKCLSLSRQVLYIRDVLPLLMIYQYCWCSQDLCRRVMKLYKRVSTCVSHLSFHSGPSWTWGFPLTTKFLDPSDHQGFFLLCCGNYQGPQFTGWGTRLQGNYGVWVKWWNIEFLRLVV